MSFFFFYYVKVEEAKRSAEATALLNQRHWEWEEWRRAKEGLMEIMGRCEGVWRPRDAAIVHHDASTENDATNTFRRSIGSTLSKIGSGHSHEVPSTFPPLPQSQLTTEMHRYVEVVHSINMREFRGTTRKIPGNIAQEFVAVAESVRCIYLSLSFAFVTFCFVFSCPNGNIETIHLLSWYLMEPSKVLLSCKRTHGNC